MNKLIYRLSLLFYIFQISASELLSSPEKSWPRSENGKLVVKEFRLESRLERVTRIPRAVPNNYLITFHLEGKDAQADIFRVKYSKYRGKVDMYEPFLLAGPGSSWQLTIDAITVNPPTDKRFGFTAWSLERIQMGQSPSLKKSFHQVLARPDTFTVNRERSFM